MRRSEKINLVLVVFMILVGCTDSKNHITKVPEYVDLEDSFFIHINLMDQSDDSFKVEMYVGELQETNNIFQFVATMPGIYSYADAGRFVYDFKVQDINGNELHTSQLNENQWQLFSPSEIYKISYKVYDTFDHEVPTNPIFAMAGTSLAEDHVLLNTPMVFGYPIGMKNRDYYLTFDQPYNWTVATAMPKADEGVYYADNFGLLADSPLIIGELTTASMDIASTTINVSVYSKYDLITANDILTDVEQVILDAQAFLKVLPTDHYDFLFHFNDFNAGALEHYYSSLYVLSDRPYNENYTKIIKSISAHEFFHIVTPLNIQSEIIADFNFAVPTPSQHLWLYEGVTEWASDYMQFRNGSMTLESLLNQMTIKARADKNSFDSTYSLVDVSTKVYTDEGQDQFANVYFRGAMVASLLDIRLLELSNGAKGLREVLLDLIAIYGPDQSFSEAGFFDFLVTQTFPEIEVFIKDYIQGTSPLPIKDYYLNIGIEYDESTFSFTKVASPTASQDLMYASWATNM